MKLLALVFAVAFSGMAAQAADYANQHEQNTQWEFTGATNAAFNILSFGNDDGKNQKGTRSLSLDTLVGYFVMPDQLEVNLGLNASVTNDGSTTSTITPAIGLTYNFMDKPANAVYLRGLVGDLMTNNGSADPNYSQFMFKFALGKRFEIVHHVSWAPELSYSHYGSTTYTPTGGSETKINSIGVWTLTPFQFTVLF